MSHFSFSSSFCSWFYSWERLRELIFPMESVVVSRILYVRTSDLNNQERIIKHDKRTYNAKGG